MDPLLTGQVVELRFDPFELAAVEIWQEGHFVTHAQVQKLDRSHHLALDRIPAPHQEVKPEQIDFLAALRAEHRAHLIQESGAISFARVLRQATAPAEPQPADARPGG